MIRNLLALAITMVPLAGIAAPQIDPPLLQAMSYLRGTPGEEVLQLLPRTKAIRFGSPLDASPYEPLTEASDLSEFFQPGITVTIHKAFRDEDPRLLAPLVAFGLMQSQFLRRPERIGDNSPCSVATEKARMMVLAIYDRYPELKRQHTYLADQYPALLAGHRGLCYPFE
jgi:hypothetical protein